MVLSLRAESKELDPTMVVWDKFMERFSESMRKLTDQLAESLKQAYQKSEPKHNRRVLICGYTQEDDCLCVATESMEPEYDENDDLGEVVLDCEEEDVNQIPLQNQPLDPVVEDDGDLFVHEAKDHKILQATPEDSSPPVHPFHIQFINGKVSSLHNEFSIPSLFSNTAIGKFSTNEKEFHVANKVFDKHPERNGNGYIVELKPKPPNAHLNLKSGYMLSMDVFTESLLKPPDEYQSANHEHVMRCLRPATSVEEVTYPIARHQASWSRDDLPRTIAFTLHQGSSSVTSMDFHPSHHTLLLVGFGNGDITIWEVRMCEKLVFNSFKIWNLSACSLTFQASVGKDALISVSRVTWSPYRNYLGAAFTKHLIHLYAYAGPNDLSLHLEIDAHVGRVNDLVFAHLDKLLCIITCGDDKLLKVWVLTGRKLFNLEVKMILAGQSDEAEQLWESFSDGKVILNEVDVPIGYGICLLMNRLIFSSWSKEDFNTYIISMPEGLTKSIKGCFNDKEPHINKDKSEEVPIYIGYNVVFHLLLFSSGTIVHNSSLGRSVWFENELNKHGGKSGLGGTVSRSIKFVISKMSKVRQEIKCWLLINLIEDLSILVVLIQARGSVLVTFTTAGLNINIVTGKLYEAVSVGSNDTFVVYYAKEETLKSFKWGFEANHAILYQYKEKLNLGQQLDYYVRTVKYPRQVQMLAGAIIGVIVIVVILCAAIHILVLLCFDNPFSSLCSLLDDRQLRVEYLPKDLKFKDIFHATEGWRDKHWNMVKMAGYYNKKRVIYGFILIEYYAIVVNYFPLIFEHGVKIGALYWFLKSSYLGDLCSFLSTKITPAPGILKFYKPYVFDQLNCMVGCPLLVSWNSALSGFILNGRIDIVGHLNDYIMVYGVVWLIPVLVKIVTCFREDFYMANEILRGYGPLKLVWKGGNESPLPAVFLVLEKSGDMKNKITPNGLTSRECLQLLVDATFIGIRRHGQCAIAVMFMKSGETAAGDFPELVIQTMAKNCIEAEDSLNYVDIQKNYGNCTRANEVLGFCHSHFGWPSTLTKLII